MPSMTKFLFTIIISILGMLYGFFVGASWNIERTTQFDTYLQETIDWIGANSHYDTSKVTVIPVVVLADQETLEYIWRMRRGSSEETIGAFYSYEEYDDKVIHKLFLHNTFSTRRVYDGKTGVHEIVHFIQKITGASSSFKCRNESEYDAYNLAADWMEQQGFTDPTWLAKYRALGDSKSQCK